MLRRLACAAVAVFGLVLVPVALADGGPSPGVFQAGGGVTAPGGTIRYVALPAGSDTTIEAIRTSDGNVLRFASLVGSWGTPSVTFGGQNGGVSADRKTLVLGDAGAPTYPLRAETRFMILWARTFQQRELITLRGDFAFDAISPSGSKLYLIQHVSANDLTRYVVRAYDLDSSRLLPGRIADRTQRGWVMAGSPVSRATSPGGRWVYTLYQRNGGYPFVHALDTVRGVAHCIGIPWTGSANAPWNMVLSVKNHGRTLAIHWRSGRGFLLMDTRTWRLSTPGSGFPWWAILLAAAAALAFVAAITRGSLRRARRSAPALAAGGSGPIPALHDARPESG
jgi:hypothetical protein